MADETKKSEASNRSPSPSVGAVREPPEDDKGQSKLMREALGRYGIKPDHVLSSKDYGDKVVIVTKGGSKVSFVEGDEVKKLTKVQLDGVPPPKASE